MKLTKKQLNDIVEVIFEHADRDIEVNGPQDFDVSLNIPVEEMDKVLGFIQSILGESKNDVQELFDIQTSFQKRVRNGSEYIPTSLIQHARLMFIGIITEACEALETLDWKPWKKNTGVDIRASDNFKKEIIDLWHFVINLTLTSGMDVEEVVRRFKEKNKINIKRQEDKY